MQNLRRLKTRPFWSLIILATLFLMFRIVMLVVIYMMRKNTRINISLTYLTVEGALITTIVLGEAIVYWNLRRRFYKMLWVWWHVILLYVVLIILPLIYVFIF